MVVFLQICDLWYAQINSDKLFKLESKKSPILVAWGCVDVLYCCFCCYLLLFIHLETFIICLRFISNQAYHFRCYCNVISKGKISLPLMQLFTVLRNRGGTVKLSLNDFECHTNLVTWSFFHATAELNRTVCFLFFLSLSFIYCCLNTIYQMCLSGSIISICAER